MIEQEKFFEEIKRLEKWTRPLSEDQREILYQEMKHIPEQALKDIVSELISSVKPKSAFPSISELKDVWIAWLQSHPEMQTTEFEDEYCFDCAGKGYIEVVYDTVKVAGGGVVEYKTILPCGACRNNWKKVWSRKPKKLWTVAEIREKHPEWRIVGNSESINDVPF